MSTRSEAGKPPFVVPSTALRTGFSRAVSKTGRIGGKAAQPGLERILTGF